MGIRLDSPPREYLDHFPRLVVMSPQRASPRLDARLEVRFYHREQLIKEYTENICQEVLFVPAEEVFPSGGPASAPFSRVSKRLDRPPVSLL